MKKPIVKYALFPKTKLIVPLFLEELDFFDFIYKGEYILFPFLPTTKEVEIAIVQHLKLN
jgi:hypothetical protein